MASTKVDCKNSQQIDEILFENDVYPSPEKRKVFARFIRAFMEPNAVKGWRLNAGSYSLTDYGEMLETDLT